VLEEIRERSPSSYWGNVVLQYHIAEGNTNAELLNTEECEIYVKK